MRDLDYRVKRSEDCILIDVNNWLQNTSNLIQRYRINGKAPVNYITEVIKENLITEEYKGILKEGDIVLLSKVISEMSQYSKFEVQGKRYYNVPFYHVFGIFKNKNISYDSLEIITDKLLLKKLDIKASTLDIPDTEHTSVYKVLKAGNFKIKENKKMSLSVQVNDVVLLRDNVITNIVLEGNVYSTAEEESVIAIFNDDTYSLDNARIINESILLKHYIPKNVLNSILLTPELDYENEDYSSIYNRDLFQVSYIDPKIDKLKKEDVVIVNDNITFYAYYNNEKYNMLNGISYIEGKIER